MQRRTLIKSIGLMAAGGAIGNTAKAAPRISPDSKKKKALCIAHVTDVHLRPEYNAPERFIKCMHEIKKHDIDFILNGGDSIYAADYNNITRDRVNLQWNLWEQARQQFKEYEMHSCLGNHDMWWAAPDRQDSMYGKDYVVKQLAIPKRYYSFDKKGWHFVILDSNNEHAGSLDNEQRTWLENDLAALPAKQPVLVMSHYPILAVCTHIDGGNHTDSKYIAELFYQHKDKKIACISGHIHLLDYAWYNGVQYFCNGAMSGFWWEPGDKNSAGPSWYYQTPPGYAIINLYEDGRIDNEYIPITV
jgi:3',5'-cyclic AMP phosphodiesterase CpdA